MSIMSQIHDLRSNAVIEEDSEQARWSTRAVKVLVSQVSYAESKL